MSVTTAMTGYHQTQADADKAAIATWPADRVEWMIAAGYGPDANDLVTSWEFGDLVQDDFYSGITPKDHMYTKAMHAARSIADRRNGC